MARAPSQVELSVVPQRLTSCEARARDHQRCQRTEQALVSLIGPAWADRPGVADRPALLIDLALLIERASRIERALIDR